MFFERFGRLLGLGLVLIAISAALTACGGGGETATTTEQESSERKPGSPTAAVSPQQGKQLFDSLGCGGCHTLAAAGAQGTVGPDLDEALRGASPDFIRESLVDPSASVAAGYPGIMPSFSRLSATELDSLVGFLAQSTSK